MVKIRLRRTGAKKKPSYRVVVADSRSPRDGRFIEIIGHYNPRTEPVTLNLHEDRVLHWLSVGAQPTAVVETLLKNSGTLDRFARLKQGTDLQTLLTEAQPPAGNGAPVVRREQKAVETAAPVVAEPVVTAEPPAEAADQE